MGGFIEGAIVGGIAGALLAGGNNKTRFAIKDRSVLFKSKRKPLVLKKEILVEILDLPMVEDSKLDRELSWNDIYVEKVGKITYIEVELVDSKGYLTSRNKIDLLKIANITKRKATVCMKESVTK